jgi:O-antigen/teichoic acid export membrane protein
MTPASSSQPGKSAHADIRRGFVWLGAASVVARILEGGSVFVVMWFVTREQIGVATLAWSVAVFLEAMNGLGLSTALLQATETSRERLTAAFWFTLGLATFLVLLVCALCIPLASFFGEPTLAPMLVVSSTKLWFVGAALVPLNQLNRATRFERLALISTLASLGSGLLTCGLAVTGYQAWSLVLGQTSHGLFTALVAYWVHPFRPSGKPQFETIRADVAFGAKAASAAILHHFYRNADYYLIGRFLGTSAVGVYRVAFDFAMTPTMAVSQVVNRSALPVYARLSATPKALLEAFLWTLRSLGVLLAPVTAVLLFAADDLLRWVNAGRWLDAAPMVRWLALAALLRCIGHTFPQLFHACRRPALALYDSLLTMLILLSFLAIGLHFAGPSQGPVVAAWAWAGLYPITLLVQTRMAQSLLPLRFTDLARALKHAAGSLALMGAVALAHNLLLRPLLPAWAGAVLSLALILISFALYVRLVMGLTLRSLSARGDSVPPPAHEAAVSE